MAQAGQAATTVTRPPHPASTAGERGRTAEAEAGHLLIVSGLSGAGKSQAMKLFEDAGYYCVDNLPPDLLDRFIALREQDPDRYRRAALVLDIRAGDPAPAIGTARATLAGTGVPVLVVFLEASDAVLVRRFSETRHRHPLERQRGVEQGIVEERRRLAGTRRLADHVIDTSSLSVGQLRERLFRIAPRAAPQGLAIDVVTFGFKHGLPLEADLVFDVRFLTNPYYVPDLKPLSGLHASVRDYVLEQPAAGRFLELLSDLLGLIVPAYQAEGRTRLTLALGCTGGYHRSIVLAEEIARRLRADGGHSVELFHRELER